MSLGGGSGNFVHLGGQIVTLYPGAAGDVLFSEATTSGKTIVAWESFLLNLLSYLGLSAIPLSVTISSATSQTSDRVLVSEAISGSPTANVFSPLWVPFPRSSGTASQPGLLPMVSGAPPFSFLEDFSAFSMLSDLAVSGNLTASSVSVGGLVFGARSEFSILSTTPSGSVAFSPFGSFVAPLISSSTKGATYAVLPVQGGGTGLSSFVSNEVVIGGSSVASSLAQVSAGPVGGVLVSQGVSAPPQFLLVASFMVVQTFSSSPVTYTPTPRMVFCFVECVGGGGGGGSAPSAAGLSSGGGGGGGGEYLAAYFSAQSIGSGVPIVIGAGGSGGTAASGTGGTVGGATAFGSGLGSSAYLKANGGTGGAAGGVGSVSNGAALANFGSGGKGGGGGGFVSSLIDNRGEDGAFGWGATNGSTAAAVGGGGGKSFFGGGGQEACGASTLSTSSTVTDGFDCFGYGGGGGGGVTTSTSSTSLGSASGGSGGSGFVRVTEYVA